MSEPMNGASERCKRSKAECCRASEQSERWERMNVASNQVARFKRDSCTSPMGYKGGGGGGHGQNQASTVKFGRISYDDEWS